MICIPQNTEPSEAIHSTSSSPLPPPHANASITAVVLTCNRTERCQDSIRHNSESLSGFNSEILLVNNGETPISTPFASGKVHCEVINSGTNIGITGRNIALNNYKSEFLLIMDDDAYVSPDHISRMISTFHSDPKIAAVSFNIRNSQENEACLLPTVFHGCACGFRSSALQEIGGYPADFLYYGEEYCVAFRLYQQGYRIVRLDGAQHVFHARDNTGRNMNRIIRFLIRNNIRTWSSLFPRSEIIPASVDTLQRYALVALKEKSIRGFIMGCAEMPLAILRGIRNRFPLSREVFNKITMSGQIDFACRKLKSKGIHQVIICSTGKFPSIWMKYFNRNGIAVKAFWETNPCWSGHSIHSTQVITTDKTDNWKQIYTKLKQTQIAWVTGTGSLSENNFWKETLSSIGLHNATNHEAAESASTSGTFDLLQDSNLSIFTA